MRQTHCQNLIASNLYELTVAGISGKVETLVSAIIPKKEVSENRFVLASPHLTYAHVGRFVDKWLGLLDFDRQQVSIAG